MAVLKPAQFMLPVIALIIAGGWVGYRRQEISHLEEESTLLAEAISAARAADAGTGPGDEAKESSGKKIKPGKVPINWKKIADDFQTNRQGGTADRRSHFLMEQKLRAMSADEILTALNEIRALNLPGDASGMLERMLIGPLAEKDPELALATFIDKVRDGSGQIGWELSDALGKWAKKEPARATVWLDQQIAEGRFDSKSLDGKSGERLQFEGRLVLVLMGTDNAAAGQRLAGLPPEQRSEALQQFMWGKIKDENQSAYATLVREQIPEKERDEVLARPINQLDVQADFSKADEYLDRIGATAAERAALAEKAAQRRLQMLPDGSKPTRADIDAVRTWASTQAPDAVEKVAGKTLGEAIQRRENGMAFSDAAQIALEYQESSGNDDALTAFLGRVNFRDLKGEALALAGKIKDPEVRANFEKRFK